MWGWPSSISSTVELTVIESRGTEAGPDAAPPEHKDRQKQRISLDIHRSNAARSPGSDADALGGTHSPWRGV